MNEDFTKYGYSIREEKTPGDPTSFVIEKSNITADFTVAEMRLQQVRVEKMLRELIGTLALEKSKAENIATNHPSVVGMSMQDLFTCKIYYESMALVEQLPAKITEFEEALRESKMEEAHISNVLGLNFNPPTPAEVVDKAVKALEDGTPQVAHGPVDLTSTEHDS